MQFWCNSDTIPVPHPKTLYDSCSRRVLSMGSPKQAIDCMQGCIMPGRRGQKCCWTAVAFLLLSAYIRAVRILHSQKKRWKAEAFVPSDGYTQLWCMPTEHNSTGCADCSLQSHTLTEPHGFLEATKKYFLLTTNVFLLVLIFRASQRGKEKIVSNEELKAEQSVVSHYAGEGGKTSTSKGFCKTDSGNHSVL